jgi:hypothetical protein
VAKEASGLILKKAGRPTSYKPEYAGQAEKLCLLGATDIELADFFEISVATLNKWKIKYPEFVASICGAKEIADARVERSLYQSYTFDSEKVFQFQGTIVRAPIREHIPPDTAAGMFWLKNRRPDKWRDVHKHEVGGLGDFSNKSDAELLQEIAEDAAELGIVVPKEYTEH